MRIGIDSRGLLHPQKTGLEWYETHLLKALSKIDLKNEYWLYLNRDLKETFPPNFKKRVLFWPLMGFNQVRLPLDFLFFKPDVFFFPVLVRPFYCPCKSVVMVHDLNFLIHPESYSFLSKTRLVLSVRMAVKKSDQIITPSNFTKNEVIKYYGVPSSKINVIYEGYDAELFRPSPPSLIKQIKTKYGLSFPYIIHIAGRFQKHKNTEKLIEAFYFLKKNKKIKHKLVILGKKDKSVESHYPHSLRLAKKLKIDQEVLFLGYLPEEDLPPLLTGASVFVFPSLYEGFGLPPLEAMACGTPVVASNTSSMPEIIQDDGILIDPQNVQEIADAIFQVISSPTLSAEIKEKGFKKAQEFSWEKCAKETLAVLEEVGAR